IAKFLNESPFNGGASVSGTFTFTSSLPVAATALRGLTNERGEFLITTLPVLDLSVPAVSGPVVFPHFVSGVGWTTQVLLVNPTDSVLTGTIQMRDPSGQNLAFGDPTYSIPPRASQKLQNFGAPPPTLTGSILSGSVRVVPAPNTPAPSGAAIFSSQ